MNGQASLTVLGGRLDHGRHRLPVRVYWEDTDAGGIVYHAGYLRFLERGRTELLRALGIDQTELMAATGVTFAVRRMTIEFQGAARLDDVLEIETRPKALRGASLVIGQSIRRGEMVLMSAEVTCACVRAGRAVRLPAAVREKLAALTSPAR